MITAKNFSSFDSKKVENIAGLKFHIERCIGESCLRNGAHSSHFWYDTTVISDLITVSFEDAKGKSFSKQIWIPARQYNFEFSIWKVKKIYHLKKEKDIIDQALLYAEENCFDPAGDPNNMAEKLDFSSYNKFLKSLEDEKN